MTIAIKENNKPIYIATQKTSAEDGLVSNTLNKNDFFNAVEKTKNNVLELLTRYNLTQKRLSPAELEYLKKLINILQNPIFTKNYQKYLQAYLVNQNHFTENHDKFQTLSVLFQETSELALNHNEQISFDEETYLKNTSDCFKKFLKEYFWLKQLNCDMETYRQLNLEQMIEQFNKITNTDIQKKMIFWFSYARINWRFTYPNDEENVITKKFTGDCSQFTMLNSLLLRGCGYKITMPFIQIGSKRDSDNHMFVVASKNNKIDIFDTHKISEYRPEITDKENYYLHMNKIKALEINYLSKKYFHNKNLVDIVRCKNNENLFDPKNYSCEEGYEY